MEKRLNIDFAGSITEFQNIIKNLELKTKLYKTLFRGKGLEFDGYRYYEPDDDSENIDWKASKRANRVLVKQYKEERNYEFLFVIDVGNKMLFGSGKKLKCEYAAEIAIALASLTLSSGNKFGFILYSDKIKNFVLPNKGQNHLAYFIDVLSNIETYGGNSDINVPLDYLINLRRKSVVSVVFLSDFLNLNRTAEKKFGLISRVYETMAFMIKDDFDVNLPDFQGQVIFEDADSGEQMLVDPSLARQQFAKYSLQQEKEVLDLLRKNGIDSLKLNTKTNFAAALAEFLRARIGNGRLL